MPTYYGMHDAPGGRQSMDSFQRPDGTPLQPGDMKSFLTPWGLLNPFLEAMMLKEGFIIDGKFTKNPDYGKLEELLKRNIRYLTTCPTLERWHNNGNKLLNSRNKLTQAYNVISMEPGDRVYVRGKKGFLNEGYLFEVVDTNLEYIFKNEKYWSMIKLRTLCKVSDDIYAKINFNSSFQKIKSPERIETLSSLI